MSVTCKICGLVADSLTSHIRIHNIKSKEYKIKFPRSKLISSKINIKRKATNKKKYGCEIPPGCVRLVKP